MIQNIKIIGITSEEERMKEIQTISIKCDCDKTIDFHELQSFQGGLKEHTESDYEKAKKSILQ